MISPSFQISRTGSFSQQLASLIAKKNFSNAAAIVIGYGHMGQAYVEALRALGVRKITVCSRSERAANLLKDQKDVHLITGSFQKLDIKCDAEALAIVAVPINQLIEASRYLANHGWRRLLIEKPIALCSRDIEVLEREFERLGVQAACAYNRVAYPSFYELKERVRQEGGATSCLYTFTEVTDYLRDGRRSQEELNHWGLANSLHVLSMAHGIIGWPKQWRTYRKGVISWHPSGSVFVGAGLSESEIPFAYHADWNSKGRWSVEVHTKMSSYRHCPLEKLFMKTESFTDWQEVEITAFSPQVKAGIAEEIASMLDSEIRSLIPLMNLHQAVFLTRFGEDVFGYADETPSYLVEKSIDPKQLIR